jgi:hypothetical protein
MTAVNPGYALYLRSLALFVSSNDSGFSATWGDRAVDSEIISPLATIAGANAEAARQFAFLKGPLVEDRLTVAGARRDLAGKVITAQGSLGDYGSGVAALVIGYREDETTTDLFVIRKLSP